MWHDHARDAFVPPLSAQDVVDLLLVDWHWSGRISMQRAWP